MIKKCRLFSKKCNCFLNAQLLAVMEALFLYINYHKFFLKIFESERDLFYKILLKPSQKIKYISKISKISAIDVKLSYYKT